MSFVVGTGMNTPPVQLLNTANAITEKHIQPIIGDVTFIPSPLFWAFTKDGKKFATGELVYPEATTEEMTGGAYYGDQLLDTAVVDSLQPANQVWRFYRQTLSLPITDVILNRGGAMGLDIVKAKFQIASASFLQKLCRALWHTSPQNTALDIDDLDAWIRQTTNVIAGIDRSVAANAFWLPGANVSSGGAALSQTVAENGYQSVVFGYDEPDFMVMDNTRFAAFKNNFVGLERFTANMQDKEAIQAGFRYHFLYNNCVVMADRFAPAQRAYILNTKYIWPVFHEDDYFTIDPWLKPSNQRVITTSMYLAWQVSNVSPRMNMCFTNLA